VTQGGFIPLPSWAVDERDGIGQSLKCHVLATYVALLGFRQRYTSAKGLRGPEARESKAAQTFHVSLPRIAKAAGVSRSTAHRALIRLELAGLVTLVERGGPGRESVYQVHDAPTGSVHQKPHSVSVTLPTFPTDAIGCQADTLVRSEVRSEIREGNGDGNGDSPSAVQANGNDKKPDQRATLAGYRKLVDMVRSNKKALAGLRRALAADLHVSEGGSPCYA
jgi:hypothetical protein